MKKYMVVILLWAATLVAHVFCMDKDKMDKFEEAFFSPKNGKLTDFDTERELIRSGLDINQPLRRSGSTLLHHLLTGPSWGEHHYYSHIKFLLEHGANLEVRNTRGYTPFDEALANGNSKDLALLSTFGYHFFPKSVNPEENPLELLRNKAQLYKDLIKKGDTKATNTLATLFMFIQNNENQRMKAFSNCYWIKKNRSSLVVNKEGCCFKHTTFADLADLVGKEAVDFVAQDLNMLSTQAFDVSQEEGPEEQSFYAGIECAYPFVRIYRERNPLELLKNGAQLHRQQIELYADCFPEEHDFILADFLKVISFLKKEKQTLHYCFEKIQSFDDLERIIGKDGMEYVKKNLLTMSEQLEGVENFPWNDQELCSYFDRFFKDKYPDKRDLLFLDMMTRASMSNVD